ncbi:MAG: mucoidy inhibitor MuiA family protein [Phycisphaerales bacterium]|nr:mucoidy inhibitor MuiA family protein [Phycisphaerales bacterium]
MQKLLATMIIVLISTMNVSGQDVAASQRIEIESQPTKVTAYRGRAWVERAVSQALQPGLYRLVFSNLPPRWQPESVQARVSGPAKVVGIDTMTRQVSTPPSNLKELVDAVKVAQRSVQNARDDVAVTDASIAYLQAMMSKAASGEQQNAGTASLDIESVQKQMEFFSEQMRMRLQARLEGAEDLDARQRALDVAESNLDKAGGAVRTERLAVVEIAVTEAGSVDATLGYLVSNANWQPRYDVRGDLDGGTVSVEYGAEVFQQSGEDWSNVMLVLSTAQPSQAANPPTMHPVYVDVRIPPPPSGPSAKRSGSRGGGGAFAVDSMVGRGITEGEAQEWYGSNAQIQGGGSSVTFMLPRRMTVETDSDSAQRTRIADFNAEIDFTFVAMPTMTEQVYLRGRFVNASKYQLLPGSAGIFMGGDYVGPTNLSSTAPGARMELYFGADPSLEATRSMQAKNTGTTGVFGGWLTTSYQFVIKVDNGSSRPVKMELWDRRPVSRSDEIDVSLLDVVPSLSTDARYIADDQPKGLLRWDLTVPANRTGDNAFTVTYDLKVERKADVEMTPLPD